MISGIDVMSLIWMMQDAVTQQLRRLGHHTQLFPESQWSRAIVEHLTALDSKPGWGKGGYSRLWGRRQSLSELEKSAAEFKAH